MINDSYKTVRKAREVLNYHYEIYQKLLKGQTPYMCANSAMQL